MPRDGGASVVASPRGAGIRTRLVLLALAVILPVLGFAGLATWRFAGAQRDGLERSLMGRTQTLARALDAEIAGLTVTLRAVAATASFQEGDLNRVWRHMAAVARDLGGAMSLRDAEERLVLYSAVAPGEPLPDMPPPPGLHAVATGGQPRLLDLIRGQPSGQPVYAVWLPVRDGAGRLWLIGAGFRVDRLVELLRREVPEPGWTAALVDRENRVIARTVRPEQTIGTEAHPRFATHLGQVWRATNAEGREVVASTLRAASGWLVGISIPAALVDAPVQRATWALAAVGAALLGCATLLALVAARRIAGAIRHLSEAARALGGGAPVPPVHTALREVDEVGAVLAEAAATLAAGEAALREREAQLARTQRLARVGGFEIIVTPGGGPGGRTEFRNIRSPEYLALHGLGPESADEPHEAWERRIHPEDRARVAGEFLAAVQGRGDGYRAEYRIVTTAGEERWISALAEIERDAEGQARHLRGVHVDVSALRRAEARVAEHEAELEAAEERLRLALEAGGLVAFDLDLDAEIGVWSPGHFDFLGVPVPPDGRASMAAWRPLVHPDDRAAMRAARDRAVAEGRTYAVEHRIRRPKDGAWRWIAVTGRTLAGTRRFVGVYADITERREAQAALEARVREAVDAAEAAQEQLAQSRKLEALGQLTGGVAHDFNNLLQVVTSGAALLRKRAVVANDPGAMRLLEGMTSAAERGASLTQRMLAFARRQELRTGAVDTAALIRSMREMLSRSLGPQVRLEQDLPEDLWWVMTDPNQLELAILNLCVNARDAMPPDRYPEARLRVAGRNRPGDATTDSPVPGDAVVLSVTDHGMGMDAETLARAMEPFFTTKGVGRGTGLGLSMVHGLAAQSGGALRLHSVPGEGTTAEIWLPRAPLGSEPAPGPVFVPPARPASRPLSVLVVDDDPLVLASTAALLADLGHASREAATAAAALEALAAGPLPDLVLTDHAMPGMTGTELAARLAVLYPGLRIILASGYADLPEGTVVGVPRLDKPFGRDLLARALASVMEDGAGSLP
ncbi:PAS domain-containing protein [Muricoccus radiodurans]|uniref:PAS domain-containing protein n=1 Tax=Muricoccus radiodurans TaxID=2231721 RepID=UPI003CF338ED